MGRRNLTSVVERSRSVDLQRDPTCCMMSHSLSLHSSAGNQSPSLLFVLEIYFILSVFFFFFFLPTGNRVQSPGLYLNFHPIRGSCIGRCDSWWCFHQDIYYQYHTLDCPPAVDVTPGGNGPKGVDSPIR